MSDVMTLKQAEDLFNLPDPYGESDVKSAYRKLILEKHPDVRKDVDKETANREASEINAANKLLTNRFSTNKEAMFARQKETPSYTYTRPQSQYQPSWNTSPTPQGTPSNTPFNSNSVYEEEIPVEEVTWEDLVNDFWEEYHAESIERRSSGTGYTFDDLKRDAAVSAFAWASRKVAQTLDGKAAEAIQDPEVQAANAVYQQYEAEKKSINRRTGRIVVFLVTQTIAALSSGAAAMLIRTNMYMASFLMLCALVIGGCGIINLVFPFITVALRKRPYRRLDEKYEHVFRSG